MDVPEFNASNNGLRPMIILDFGKGFDFLEEKGFLEENSAISMIGLHFITKNK